MAIRSRRSDNNDPDEGTDTRTSRRRSAESDEEPRGRGNRRSSREDDTPDDEPRGRRSRGSSRDEEDPPRRGRGRRSDNEDDKPKRGRGRANRGFDSYKEKRVVGGGDFADEFRPSKIKGSTLIKFLEDGPFDNYLQHWIDELKKHSYVCHDDEYFDDYQDGCPLCEIGDKPKTVSLYNILDLTDPRKPKVKIWAPGVTVSDLIERLAESSKTSPINRDDLYFEVETTEKNKKWTTTILPVKARDLEEDFEMKPLSDDEIDGYLEDIFEDRADQTQVETYDDLVDIAKQL